jgi:hypothetical protein
VLFEEYSICFFATYVFAFSGQLSSPDGNVQLCWDPAQSGCGAEDCIGADSESCRLVMLGSEKDLEHVPVEGDGVGVQIKGGREFPNLGSAEDLPGEGPLEIVGVR